MPLGPQTRPWPPILYEDNHLLVVEKPPNMPVQADASGDLDLLSALKEYIKEKHNKPGEVYLGLCHRLDRPVGGVMVFARTSKAAARLTAQFKGREARKRYAAVVQDAGPAALPQAGEWEDDILAREGELRVRVLPVARESAEKKHLPANAEGAKRARLRYHVLKRREGEALLDIELLTGRKHQIRAQAAAHGAPILYDQRYNPAPGRGQIALWAYALSIIHPTKKERMEFFSLPRGAAFAPFAAQASGLPAYAVCEIAAMEKDLLAVCKRAGVETSLADAGERSLQAALEKLYGEAYPLHRLDANTEGLVLFARSLPAKEALERALAEEETKKIYHCLVLGEPPQREAELRAWAEKDSARAYLYVYDEPRPGAQPIRTAYRVLERRGEVTKLEVRLFTGRTHQIRAHLAHIGCPVLGDDKYGNREANKHYRCKRQQLIANYIRLHMPEEAAAYPAAYAYLDGKAFWCAWELAWPETPAIHNA